MVTSPAGDPHVISRFSVSVPYVRIVEVAGAPHGIREYLPTAARSRDELTRFLESQDA